MLFLYKTNVLFFYIYSLSLTPQTAVLGDYAVLDNPLVTFSPGSPSTQTRNITIIDDNAVENLEIFEVRLQPQSGNVQIAPVSTAVISIIDNDGKQI